jgi:hypothetical protein
MDPTPRFTAARATAMGQNTTTGLSPTGSDGFTVLYPITFNESTRVLSLLEGASTDVRVLHPHVSSSTGDYYMKSNANPSLLLNGTDYYISSSDNFLYPQYIFYMGTSDFTADFTE